jgi:hypothetical protein
MPFDAAGKKKRLRVGWVACCCAPQRPTSIAPRLPPARLLRKSFGTGNPCLRPRAVRRVVSVSAAIKGATRRVVFGRSFTMGG